MTPIVDGLEREFAGSVEIIRLDASLSENALLQQEYGVQGHPSFVTLDAGDNVQERFFGPQAEEILFQAMTEISSN
jgi:hypothetical protein